MSTRILILILSVASLFPVSDAFAQNYPASRGAVNDFAGVLSPGTEQKGEALAIEVHEKTGAAIVAVVVRSLEEVSIEEYAVELFERWGIGERGRDRGVLLLLSVEERRLRIEVGYGLEGIIPDGRAGSIRDRYVVPHLRHDDWDAGVLGGMAALAQLILDANGVEGGRPSTTSDRDPESAQFRKALFGLFLILVLAVLVYTIAERPGRGGRYIRTRRGRIRRWGGYVGTGGSFGSWGGGFGGFGGGGGGSGGFSGFGGGMSGGGGASGSF